MLKSRIERLEARRADPDELPHWTLELDGGRKLDFFRDPGVVDILGWGGRPRTYAGKILSLRGELRRR